MSDSGKSVSLVIPTRNEVENIAPLVAQIFATGIPFREILFIDDDSSDGTIDVIRSLSEIYPVRYLQQNAAKPGLAAAIMSAAAAAEGELLVVMDADLSHPPERIADLLAPVLAGTADMVIGSRYMPGGATPGWPIWRRTLSRAGSALAYPLTGLRDSMAGFFVIGRSRLLEVAPPRSGFKIAFETVVHAGPALRVCEIPIVFRDRARGRSKMSFAVALRFLLRWLIAFFRRVHRRRPLASGSAKLREASVSQFANKP